MGHPFPKFPKKTRQKGAGNQKDRLVINFPDGKSDSGRCLYRRVYLGFWDDPAAHAEYERQKSEFYLRGDIFYLPDKKRGLSVCELVEKFLNDASDRYMKHGKQTGTFSRYVRNLKPLVESFGGKLVEDFGYEDLKAIQTSLDRNPKLCRDTVNKYIDNIKTVFRWGRENRIVSREVLADIEILKNLRKGACRSADHAPIRSVSDSDIEAIQPFLSPVLRAMVALQRATGWRPEEVRILRLADINRETTPWEYRPISFKTEHIQAERVLLIGPRARKIISDYAFLSKRIEFDHSDYLFKPYDSLRWYIQERITNGGEKTESGLDYDNKTSEHFTCDSYSQAIRRSCKKAGISPFSPYRIRHAKATELERIEGIKGVQAALGHANPNTSRRYVDPDTALAERIAEQYG